MSARLATGSPKRASSHIAPVSAAPWSHLSEAHQVALADAAMREAVVTVAEQASVLADAIEAGVLADRGGADALRLLSRLMHATGRESLLPAGHA